MPDPQTAIDPNLEADVQKMLDEGIDEGEVRAYIRKQTETPGFLSRTVDAVKGAVAGLPDIIGAGMGYQPSRQRLAEGAAQTAIAAGNDFKTRSVPSAVIRTAGRVVGIDPENLQKDYDKGNYAAMAGDVLPSVVMGLAPSAAGPVARATTRVRNAVAGAVEAPARLAARGTGAVLQDTGKFILSPPGVKTAARPIGNALHEWALTPEETAFRTELESKIGKLPPASQDAAIKRARLNAKTPEREKTLAMLEIDLEEQRALTPDPVKTAIAEAKAHETANKLRSGEEIAAAKAQQAVQDEAAQATRDTANRARIDAAKEGREASAPRVSEGVSVQNPDGSRSSMSTSYREPEVRQTPATPDVTVGGRSLASMSPRAQEAIRAAMEGTTPAVAHPTPAPVVQRVAKPRVRNEPIDDIPTQSKVARDLGDILSEADVTWLQETAKLTGLKPGMNITALHPEVKAALIKARASRNGTHYANGVSDKIHREGTQTDRLGSPDYEP